MSTRVIGITGFARHGKDTVGSLLVEEYGFTKVAFADALRSMALAINPYVSGGNIRLNHWVDNLGWDEAKKDHEIRRLLQAIGTEGVRGHLGDDAWIRAAKRTIDQVDGPVVITDVRFPNEADAVHEWYGDLWRVARVNVDGSQFDNGVGSSHASESHIAGLPVDRAFVAYHPSMLRDLVRDLMGPPTDHVTQLMQLATADSEGFLQCG